MTDEQRVRKPQGYTVLELPVRNLHVSGDWRNVLKALGFQGCGGKEAYYSIIQSSFQQSAVVITGERGLLP